MEPVSYTHLDVYKRQEELIPAMAEDAMKSGNIPANPRQTTVKDIMELYRKAL